MFSSKRSYLIEHTIKAVELKDVSFPEAKPEAKEVVSDSQKQEVLKRAYNLPGLLKENYEERIVSGLRELSIDSQNLEKEYRKKSEDISIFGRVFTDRKEALQEVADGWRKKGEVYSKALEGAKEELKRLEQDIETTKKLSHYVTEGSMCTLEGIAEFERLVKSVEDRINRCVSIDQLKINEVSKLQTTRLKGSVERIETTYKVFSGIRDGAMLTGATLATGGAFAAVAGSATVVAAVGAGGVGIVAAGAGIAAGTVYGGAVGALTSYTEAGIRISQGLSADKALSEAKDRSLDYLKSSAIAGAGTLVGVGVTGALLGKAGAAIGGKLLSGGIGGASGAVSNESMQLIDAYHKSIDEFKAQNIQFNTEIEREKALTKFLTERGLSVDQIAKSIGTAAVFGAIGGAIGQGGNVFQAGKIGAQKFIAHGVEVLADGAAGAAEMKVRGQLDLTNGISAAQGVIIGAVSSHAGSRVHNNKVNGVKPDDKLPSWMNPDAKLKPVNTLGEGLKRVADGLQHVADATYEKISGTPKLALGVASAVGNLAVPSKGGEGYAGQFLMATGKISTTGASAGTNAANISASSIPPKTLSLDDIRLFRAAFADFASKYPQMGDSPVMGSHQFYEFCFKSGPQASTADYKKASIDTKTTEKLMLDLYDRWYDGIVNDPQSVIARRPGIREILPILKSEPIPDSLEALRKLFQKHPVIGELCPVAYQDGVHDHICSNFVHVKLYRAELWKNPYNEHNQRIYVNPNPSKIPVVVDELIAAAQRAEIGLHTFKFTDLTFQPANLDLSLGRGDAIVLYVNKEDSAQILDFLSKLQQRRPELFEGGQGPPLLSRKLSPQIGVTDDVSEKQRKLSSSGSTSFSKVRGDLFQEAWIGVVKELVQDQGGFKIKDQTIESIFRICLEKRLTSQKREMDTQGLNAKTIADKAIRNGELPPWPLDRAVEATYAEMLARIVPEISASSLLSILRRKLAQLAPKFDVNPNDLSSNAAA